jgi:hypothetical protein
MAVIVALVTSVGADDWNGRTVFPRQPDQELRGPSSVIGRFNGPATVKATLKPWLVIRLPESALEREGRVLISEVLGETEALEHFGRIRPPEP